MSLFNARLFLIFVLFIIHRKIAFDMFKNRTYTVFHHLYSREATSDGFVNEYS